MHNISGDFIKKHGLQPGDVIMIYKNEEKDGFVLPGLQKLLLISYNIYPEALNYHFLLIDLFVFWDQGYSSEEGNPSRTICQRWLWWSFWYHCAWDPCSNSAVLRTVSAMLRWSIPGIWLKLCILVRLLYGLSGWIGTLVKTLSNDLWWQSPLWSE